MNQPVTQDPLTKWLKGLPLARPVVMAFRLRARLDDGYHGTLCTSPTRFWQCCRDTNETKWWGVSKCWIVPRSRQRINRTCVIRNMLRLNCTRYDDIVFLLSSGGNHAYTYRRAEQMARSVFSLTWTSHINTLSLSFALYQNLSIIDMHRHSINSEGMMSRGDGPAYSPDHRARLRLIEALCPNCREFLLRVNLLSWHGCTIDSFDHLTFI